jgi:hypothetical protein
MWALVIALNEFAVLAIIKRFVKVGAFVLFRALMSFVVLANNDKFSKQIIIT